MTVLGLGRRQKHGPAASWPLITLVVCRNLFSAGDENGKERLTATRTGRRRQRRPCAPWRAVARGEG